MVDLIGFIWLYLALFQVNIVKIVKVCPDGDNGDIRGNTWELECWDIYEI